ncbi:tape measure protein [Diaphorobacter caeni]|uniref:tape measure protein n=1 Tax=Diaphorobacter caeni TaxID=2784387 RepID=UPI001890A922|nr:tape measure protein [Diaphorobacter caeni]MBF5006360.1 tape measure protein [Diaphorobacter caeni]
MANENQVEFKLVVKKDGLGELAADLTKVETKTKDLTETSTATGAALEKLGTEAKAASTNVANVGKSAEQAGSELQDLRAATEQKTAALKAGLDAERSEIGIRQEQLNAIRAEQQARLQAAQARGDERAAMEAQNDLRQTEAEQLRLAAQVKKAEASAIEEATAARRAALSAVGPLTAAQNDELRASQNQAAALRVQAEAAEQAALRSTAMGQAASKAGADLDGMRKVVDAKTAAIKAGLEAEKSEIELQAQLLTANRAAEQAALQAAQAKGDESAATRAQNNLRQIESDQLRLVAQAKRAEATAIDQATAARREQLSATGPLNAAHAAELQAAQNYASALRVEAAAADQAAQRARELGNAHKNGAAATDQMSSRVGNLTMLLGQMAGAMGAAFTFREMVTAAAQMEQLRSGLTAITRDSAKAGQELEFVRGVAVRIGADVTEVGRSFLGLSAATRGTAVEGEPTRQVFEAVATAMGKAGKTSAETSLALQALSQMASKGTVQMEELRGQLGESLPGALQAAAKGLGITTAELIKLVEEGKITATDIFPSLAKGLDEIYGGATGAQTLSQEITNVKNAFTEMSNDIGEAGGLNALKFGAELAQTSITILGTTVVATGKSIGVMLAAITSWDFSGVKQSLADIETEAREKMLKAAQHNGVLTSTLSTLGDQAMKTAVVQQQQAQASTASGTAAKAATDDFVKLNNGYRIVLESVREQIKEQEKSVIARDAEGKASVALAQSFGTEAAQRTAVASAAAADAEALQKLAQLRLTELETLKAQLVSLKAEAAARGGNDEGRNKQLADLEKLIGLRQQDADKAVAQAKASVLAAAQAKAEAEAYKDNSARIGELRYAYEQALRKLDEVRQAKIAGKATTEQLAQAEIEAGKAALLYRDAMADQLKAIEAKKNVTLQDNDLQQMQIQLAMSVQQRIYEVAKARGDEATAARAANELKRLEIELLTLTAQAKRAEADAAMASIQVKKAELIANGEYNGVKKLELDAAVKAAEAKRVEAEIAEVTAGKLRDLAAAQQQLKGDTDDATSSINKQSKALSNLNESKTSGPQFVWTQSSIVDYLKQAGLDESIAADLSKQFLNPNGDVNYEASQAQIQWGGKNSTLASALGKMVEYYKYGDGKQSYDQMVEKKEDAAELKKSTGTTATSGTAAPSTSAAPSKSSSSGMSTGNTYVSNITLPNGEKKTINYQDRNSQLSGDAILKMLAEGKGVAQ